MAGREEDKRGSIWRRRITRAVAMVRALKFAAELVDLVGAATLVI